MRHSAVAKPEHGGACKKHDAAAWGRLRGTLSYGSHMKATPLKARLMKQCTLRSLKRMDVYAKAYSETPAGTYSAVDSSARCDVCAA